MPDSEGEPDEPKEQQQQDEPDKPNEQQQQVEPDESKEQQEHRLQLLSRKENKRPRQESDAQEDMGCSRVLRPRQDNASEAAVLCR